MAKPAVKHAFRKLHDLGKETVAEVDRRLLAGDSPANVAAYIQDELGGLKDLKRGSVKKNLERYRATDLKNRVIGDIVERVTGSNTAELGKKILAYDELAHLALVQKGRLEKLLVKESSLPAGTVIQQASLEARLLKDILTELSRVQLEIGVLPRAPKKTSGASFDPITGETRIFSWTEEQEQLYKQLTVSNDIEIAARPEENE